MIAIPVLLVLVACSPTLMRLHFHWTDWARTTYTHGYLIAGVCLCLLWRNLRQAPAAPSVQGLHFGALGVLFAIGAGWVLGVRSGLVSVEWALLPILLITAIWTVSGVGAARRNAFAVGFLYFAMPLWSAATGLFQWTTVYVVRAMLRIVGIPSHFVDNTVQIPSGTFEIAGGCSGLHFVIVGLALAALMGELRGDDWRGRIKLLCIAGALAVATNWIRVFTIILGGHFTHMQSYLVVHSHYGYGWALFTVAMILFFLLERRMPLRVPKQSPDQVAAAPRHGFMKPVSGVAAVMAVVTILQYLSARQAEASVTVATPPTGWSEVQPDDWQGSVAGADSHQHKAWVSPTGRRVDRHDHLFLTQHQGKELGGYGNDLSPGDGHVVVVRYQVGNRLWKTAVPAQLHYAALSVLKLRSVPASVLVWRTPCLPDCGDAEELLRGFGL